MEGKQLYDMMMVSARQQQVATGKKLTETPWESLRQCDREVYAGVAAQVEVKIA